MSAWERFGDLFRKALKILVNITASSFRTAVHLFENGHMVSPGHV
jgi:hypothetical protein